MTAKHFLLSPGLLSLTRCLWLAAGYAAGEEILMESRKCILPQELTISITPTREDVYQVDARSSSQGEASASFHASALPGEEPSFLYRESPQSRNFTPPGLSAAERDIREIGAKLHQALFSGSVRELMQSCCNKARQDKQWLRICLRFNPSDPKAAWLDGIAWELLQDGDQGLLGLHPDWTILRYLHSPFPPRALELSAPLRILVIIAKPLGLSDLETEREHAGIKKAWQSSAGTQLEFLQPPTIPALSRCLALRDPFHVIHFMGHGGFDESSGKGYLLFEDDRRAPKAVDNDLLATFLQGNWGPSLVVLNACDTATGGSKPLSALASSLVRAGVPAVLAMKAPILDAVAVAFSTALHEALAAGQPVDLAVTAGRRALYAQHDDRFDWAIPSLYLRAPSELPSTASGAEGAEIRSALVAKKIVADEFTDSAVELVGWTGGPVPSPASPIRKK
jgi:hypothetical protein